MKCVALLFLLTGLTLSGLVAQPTSFTPSGPGGGGYMYSPSINPHQEQDFFIVCDMGGVYRTQNGGAQFELLPFEELLSTVKGKVQFTSDPNVMYSVSRSLTNEESPLFRGELRKSIDAGVHWQTIPDPTGSGIHRLEVDPDHVGRMVLNEYNQLFFSPDGGNTFQVVFQPADERLWLAGVFWDGMDIFIGTNHGLLVSHDNGFSFALEAIPGLPAEAGIFNLCGASDGFTTRLYAVVAPADALDAWQEIIDLDASLTGAYRLDYASPSGWQHLVTNEQGGRHFRLLDVAHNSIDVVYATGRDTTGIASVFKSTDGGLSWSNIFLSDQNQNIRTGWGGYAGAYWMEWAYLGLGLDVAAANPDKIVVTDGFSHISTDGGNNWRALYVMPELQNEPGSPTSATANYASSGLDVTTTHHLHWLTPESLFAASTDIGNQYSEDGGSTWQFARNIFSPWGYATEPNWYRMVAHPQSGRLYAALSEVNDMYLGYRITDAQVAGTGKVVYSDDQGQQWQVLHDFGAPVVWVALDEQHPERLFASVVDYPDGGVYRSVDGGSSWQKLGLPARTEGHPYSITILKNGGIVATCSARALPDGVTLTNSSGVFYSADGGDTWEDRSAPEMIYYTKEVILDPSDPQELTWYATVWGRFTTFEGPNNAGNGGLYRTEDGGINWERIFTHERTESATFQPGDPQKLYVTVEFGGLYYCGNVLDENPLFSLVSSYPFSRPKRVFFNPYKEEELWVTTMGGALWKGEVPVTMSDDVYDKSDPDHYNTIHVIPSLALRGSIIRVVQKNAAIPFHQWRLVNTSGAVVQSGDWHAGEQNQLSIRLSDALGGGIYFLHLRDIQGRRMTGKFIVY